MLMNSSAKEISPENVYFTSFSNLNLQQYAPKAIVMVSVSAFKSGYMSIFS
jgi:hypothetical protein